MSSPLAKLIDGVVSEKHPLYPIWLHMRQRCLYPTCKEYKYYGARGITICERWDDFRSFVEDVGTKPSSLHSLDRKDNNGNYEPDNVRWATKKEQMNNTRFNVFLEFNGERLTIKQWSERTGIKYETLRGRIRSKKNLSIEAILTIPVAPPAQDIQTGRYL